ncbi:MAG: peroxide stress protein YaaA [Eubacteriaceae bacterium]|nr:peroxide stress protein YaaA [Eubacteriaceae bacterium]MDD4507455.1 peroxide stress protein YaaA [Eubacteriaceae bacterium]
MQILLSPAKRMGNDFSEKSKLYSSPALIQTSAQILEVLKSYDAWELEKLLKVNPSLAIKAWKAFQEMNLSEGVIPAIYSYQGLAFKYLESSSLDFQSISWAQKHLWILSAFYGALRPLDLINPYRLEMGTKLSVSFSKNLYELWANQLYQLIMKEHDIIINLASEEYAKCLRRYLKVDDEMVDVVFLENVKGKYRTLATSAKMARGKMTRFIIKNKLSKINEIQSFDSLGYHYDVCRSSLKKMVFIK